REGDEVDDDRAHEVWNDRRVAADERLADEMRQLGNGGEDRDVADQQIKQRGGLPLDHLPFPSRPQDERFDPSNELAQVSCPHLFPPSGSYARPVLRSSPAARSLSSGWRDEPRVNSFGRAFHGGRCRAPVVRTQKRAAGQVVQPNFSFEARRMARRGPVIPSPRNLQKTSRQIDNRLQLPFKLLVAAEATHSPRCFRHGAGSLMELPMRKVIRIVTAALAVTALSLVAGLPLVAAWRMSAEQHAT